MTAALHRTCLCGRVGYPTDQILNSRSAIAGPVAPDDGRAAKRLSRKTSHNCDTDHLPRVNSTNKASV